LIVDFGVGGVGVVGAGVQVLLAAEFEQLDAVVGADLVSEIVEECTRFERAGCPHALVFLEAWFRKL
jgi:hypothetical protein